MSLLQDVTESEIAKDGNMPCGICPEGIADKAFPPDSTARRRCFYAAVKVDLYGLGLNDVVFLDFPVDGTSAYA